MFYMTFTNLCSSAVENQTRKIVTTPKDNGPSESWSMFQASGDLQGDSLLLLFVSQLVVWSHYLQKSLPQTHKNTQTYKHLVRIDSHSDKCGHKHCVNKSQLILKSDIDCNIISLDSSDVCVTCQVAGWDVLFRRRKKHTHTHRSPLKCKLFWPYRHLAFIKWY